MIDLFVSRIRRLRGDVSGAAAVLFAFALLPVALAIGGAIDYASMTRARAALSSGLDSATLSVAVAQLSGQNVTTNSADLTQAVRRALNGALGPTLGDALTQVSASMDDTGAVQASATAVVPTNFMRIAGLPTMSVSATTKVSAPASPVEVAMVLDTTGSMAGSKIAALQTAATSLSNTLFGYPNVKVAVVPFTDYVNIGLTYRNATWLSGAQDYTTPASGSCATQPKYVCTGGYKTVNSTCVNDGVSSPCSWQQCLGYTQQGTYQSCPSPVNHTWNGCVGSRNYPSDVQSSADIADSTNPVPALIDYWCATPLQRLTSDQNQVNAAINNLSASGETYIAPGLLWGWRALSPNAPFADGAAYNGRTRKYIVLMTDGYNTHSPNYPNHEGTDTATANTLTSQTCSAIKAKGVTIFTIAFQVSDPAIKTVLQNCATSTSGYYDSTSSSDLLLAFQTIGNSITQVRIVQ